MTTITKTQFAAELKIGQQQVTKFINKGLPVLSSGLLDRDAARAWVRKSVAGDAKAMRGLEAGSAYEPAEPQPVSAFQRGVIAALNIVRSPESISQLASFAVLHGASASAAYGLAKHFNEWLALSIHSVAKIAPESPEVEIYGGPDWCGLFGPDFDQTEAEKAFRERVNAWWKE